MTTFTEHARCNAEIDEHILLETGKDVVAGLLAIVAYDMDYSKGETDLAKLHTAYVTEYLAIVFERCET
jgi:hypothetical protein